MCGDSRHDLNYPEIPDSWNNKEKTKMANFNEKINCGTGRILRDQEYNYFIQKSDSIEEFERNIDCLQFRKDPYRLYIQYKDAHPVESIAGHCFRWECVSKTRNIAHVRCLDCDSNEYFGDPRFDYITGAIFITDKYVVTYGDTWIEAVEISGEHVVCKAYVCGRFVSEFRIPAKAFDRLFGLKENLPEQYEKVFGKAEDAKPVQEENDLIEEAKRNIESCMNLLDTNECQLGRAMDAIKAALMDIEDQKCELVDILTKLDDTLRKLK